MEAYGTSSAMVGAGRQVAIGLMEAHTAAAASDLALIANLKVSDGVEVSAEAAAVAASGLGLL